LNYLAVNTAGKIEILLKVKGKIFSSAHDDISTMVLPYINELLDEAQIKIDEIDIFGVCIGPGSFTGIRVGLSCIKALGFALNKPIIPVTYFDILAYDYVGGLDELSIVIDGKNQVSYLKNYPDNSGGICIKNDDLNVYALKNMFYDYEYSGKGFEKIMDKKIADKEYKTHAEIVPLYLRKSQPEREYGEI